jgi:hypothetical protein
MESQAGHGSDLGHWRYRLSNWKSSERSQTEIGAGF